MAEPTRAMEPTKDDEPGIVTLFFVLGQTKVMIKTDEAAVRGLKGTSRQSRIQTPGSQRCI